MRTFDNTTPYKVVAVAPEDIPTSIRSGRRGQNKALIALDEFMQSGQRSVEVIPPEGVQARSVYGRLQQTRRKLIAKGESWARFVLVTGRGHDEQGHFPAQIFLVREDE